MTKLRYLFGGSLLSLIAAVSISTTVAQVPVNHIVKGGQLTGAENVSVNGTLYNVTFLGGACYEAADFEFTDESTARWTPLTCSSMLTLSIKQAGWALFPGAEDQTSAATNNTLAGINRRYCLRLRRTKKLCGGSNENKKPDDQTYSLHRGSPGGRLPTDAR